MGVIYFFNDRNLYLRDGFTREYGEVTPRYDCAYQDGFVYAAALPHVFKKDGKYFMLYGGLDETIKDCPSMCYMMAESEDGLHFTPCHGIAAQGGLTTAKFENEYTERISAEMGTFVVDEHNNPDEKYKVFVCNYQGTDGRNIDDYILTSGDGVKFTPHHEYLWNKTGTEPCMGVFYNKHKGCYSIVMRPDGGNRKVCITDTVDFKTYTEPRLIMEPDGDDEPLSELYGMNVIDCEEHYVGILTKYVTRPARERKYLGGFIYPEIAFSHTGESFQRCMKRPFIKNGAPGSIDAGMIFVNSCYRDAENKLTLLATCCKYEHGHFRSTEGVAIVPYQLRDDGFVCMHCDSEGTLCTNTQLFEGEKLSINLKAKKATCAVYECVGDNKYELIPGFDHADCTPFSGDSTAWVPQFKQPLSALDGKVILIEIKAENADIYAIRGDFSALQLLDVWRYKNWNKQKPKLFGMN